jgi:hypothetical protein
VIVSVLVWQVILRPSVAMVLRHIVVLHGFLLLEEHLGIPLLLVGGVHLLCVIIFPSVNFIVLVLFVRLGLQGSWRAL